MATDAIWAMWIDFSSRPIQRAVYCTTLDEVIDTWVGNTRFPPLRRLARNTSPGANGRPLRQTWKAITPRTLAAAASVHQSHTGASLTGHDVKLFFVRSHRDGHPVDRARAPRRAALAATADLC